MKSFKAPVGLVSALAIAALGCGVLPQSALATSVSQEQLAHQASVVQAFDARFQADCAEYSKLAPPAQEDCTKAAAVYQALLSQLSDKASKFSDSSNPQNAHCSGAMTEMGVGSLPDEVSAAIGKSQCAQGEGTNWMSLKCAGELVCGLGVGKCPPASGQGHQSNCLIEALAGVLKSLWGNVELVWSGVTSVAGAAGEGVTSAFRKLVGVEDASSEKMLATSQQSDSALSLFRKDPVQFTKSIALGFLQSINEVIEKSYGCEAWAGVPHFSECRKPMKNFWNCATCDKRFQVICAFMGQASAEVVTAFLTGGATALLKAGATIAAKSGAAMAGKIAVLLPRTAELVGRGAEAVSTAGRATLNGAAKVGDLSFQALRLGKEDLLRVIGMIQSSGAGLLAEKILKNAGTTSGAQFALAAARATGAAGKAGFDLASVAPRAYVELMSEATRAGFGMTEKLLANKTPALIGEAGVTAARSTQAVQSTQASAEVTGKSGIRTVNENGKTRYFVKSGAGEKEVSPEILRVARLDDVERKTAAGQFIQEQLAARNPPLRLDSPSLERLAQAVMDAHSSHGKSIGMLSAQDLRKAVAAMRKAGIDPALSRSLIEGGYAGALPEGDFSALFAQAKDSANGKISARAKGQAVFEPEPPLEARIETARAEVKKLTEDVNADPYRKYVAKKELKALESEANSTQGKAEFDQLLQRPWNGARTAPVSETAAAVETPSQRLSSALNSHATPGATDAELFEQLLNQKRAGDIVPVRIRGVAVEAQLIDLDPKVSGHVLVGTWENGKRVTHSIDAKDIIQAKAEVTAARAEIAKRNSEAGKELLESMLRNERNKVTEISEIEAEARRRNLAEEEVQKIVAAALKNTDAIRAAEEKYQAYLAKPGHFFLDPEAQKLQQVVVDMRYADGPLPEFAMERVKAALHEIQPAAGPFSKREAEYLKEVREIFERKSKMANSMTVLQASDESAAEKSFHALVSKPKEIIEDQMSKLRRATSSSNSELKSMYYRPPGYREVSPSLASRITPGKWSESKQKDILGFLEQLAKGDVEEVLKAPLDRLSEVQDWVTWVRKDPEFLSRVQSEEALKPLRYYLEVARTRLGYSQLARDANAYNYQMRQFGFERR